MTLRTVTLSIEFQTDAPPEYVARILDAAVVQISEGAFYDEDDHGNEVEVPTYFLVVDSHDPGWRCEECGEDFGATFTDPDGLHYHEACKPECFAVGYCHEHGLDPDVLAEGVLPYSTCAVRWDSATVAEPAEEVRTM